VAVVLFSAADFKNTFKRAQFWISSVREKITNEILIILVENKIDVAEKETDDTIVQQYAESNGIVYCKASAKTGEGVKEVFDLVINNGRELYKS
jgi:GTPase SAR1 family protein